MRVVNFWVMLPLLALAVRGVVALGQFTIQQVQQYWHLGATVLLTPGAAEEEVE